MKRKPRWLRCVRYDGQLDLRVGRLYECYGKADEEGMLRIVDDSGEDYLYPKDWFEEMGDDFQG